MIIKGNRQGELLTVALEGRLDTTTSPELGGYLEENVAGVTALVLDFSNLAYISSAGLRVLLTNQKKMNSVKGTMVIRGANEEIKEVFDITGFADILTVE